MASNLYPLVFKPGIKRDGTPFQAEYCTDGQWIRFYRGMVKRIGGMQALPYTNNGGRYNNINTLFINHFNGTINVLLGDNQGLYKVVTDNNFGLVTNIVQLPINPNIVPDPNRLWQFVPVLSSTSLTPTNELAVLSTLNYGNILDNSQSQLINIDLTNFTTTIKQLPDNFTGIGGMLYVSPRLYIYGTDGRVQWSKNSNCYDFTGTSSSVNISSDKVIFGASIRGGSLTPTLLFWTMYSVIRLTNIQTANDNPTTNSENILNFKIDTISRDSSIMSSRCVVEYDGIFYWIGTNRFFLYNGVVLPLENNINRRYFFNNIDMNKRQKVFGVKNVAFGEIWWFYPEIANAGNPAIGCTRAIIYNIEENAWYDTAIGRDCGFFDNVSGSMYTYGQSVSSPSIIKYTWKQDVGVDEIIPSFPNRPLPAYFTTPTISWAAFNPMKQLTGIDRWMDLQRIEPDFLLDNPNNQMTVLVNIKEYANSGETTYPVNAVPIPFSGTTTKIDIHVQGRHITFTFSSSVNFEMGHIMLLLGVGDGR